MNPAARETAPFLLDPHDCSFPSPELALSEPDGLLAIGGDLRPERLLTAYRFGIFPWFSDDQPILWWSPDPRCVLIPEQLYLSRSLRKRLRKGEFVITLDTDFAGVIRACAEARAKQPGTWITLEMQQAYISLHRLGYAHSVEAWYQGILVGGLYGIALGKAFFGESMFSRRTDASKVAFAHLVRQLEAWEFELIDCQVSSAHLESLGATSQSRTQFLAGLDRLCSDLSPQPDWRLQPEIARGLMR